jgi:hypothetical protein
MGRGGFESPRGFVVFEDLARPGVLGACPHPESR